MVLDEIHPGDLALAAWCRRYAISLQDIAHRGVGDLDPEIVEGADDPVVAPGGILVDHAKDKSLDVAVNTRPPSFLAVLGTVETPSPQ